MAEKSQSKSRVTVVLVLCFFIIASVFSAMFMNRVGINYNLADYLGKDTETKIALDIIDGEFGSTGNIQVMAQNVSAETADEMQDKIENISNVLNVNFDKYDETYYKDGDALFIVIVDGNDYSDNAKQVAKDIANKLSSYGSVEYGGTTIEKQNLQNDITSEMVYILAISLCLVVTILLITSESWLEPIVLLAASGVAVLLNRGTNFFFGEISYITNSISAILQLALSIDYSIVLLHTYRREKESGNDIFTAMKSAIKSVVKPVSASALTTIAGLLALLFMSFKIGFDIGIVLMKGIVISAITSLTLLPALILLLDKPMKKAKKKAFVPKGGSFCKIAFKASKVIVPIALVVVIVCGILQTENTFIFSDTKSDNAAISDVFGKNNSVAVVYKNSDKNNENEEKLIDDLSSYKTKNGKKVLTDYTAYTNTALELYDTEKAVQKLELSEKDTEMLYTMYNLYRAPEDIKMTFAEFVNFSDNLIETDEDVKDFVDSETTDTIKKLKYIYEIDSTELTADELHSKLTTGQMSGTDINAFSVKQLYGLYYYSSVPDKNVGFCTMLDYVIKSSQNKNVASMFDAETVNQLKTLSAGIAQFKTQMETPMDAGTLAGYFYKNYGVVLSEMQLSQIYGAYFASTGQPASNTVQFLPLMKFMAASGMIPDSGAVAEINKYDALYTAVNSKYGYAEFLTALSKTASALSGQTPKITVSNESVQQIYIMYFYEKGSMPKGKLTGKAFAEYVLSEDKKNSAVNSQINNENRDKLSDMLTVNKYFSESEALNYESAFDKITALQEEIKSEKVVNALDKDKVSGVFIKYATNNGKALTEPMRACDLLDFVSENMDTNTLLEKKMNDDNRQKVKDAQEDIKKANDLFVGKDYSRMLLSINLPNESEETTEFVKYLSAKVKDVFGKDAYITGEIVSTYDLQKTFDHDNTFITVFTLISIFAIVMLIFRSLSLPVILVAVIQGAIFIAMSTQVIGNATFFMSYIISTCILMGATIDYGILMSSNYVAYRKEFDKKEALIRSVEAAMPTVFTSGLILTVCGFVIHFISSQNSISTVGLLIGIGTICSVVMITVILPSVLYLLDKFVLKLSIKSKK